MAPSMEPSPRKLVGIAAIVLLILVWTAFVASMVVATILTVMGTYYVLHRFVLDNPADPPTRAGGQRPGQTAK